MEAEDLLDKFAKDEGFGNWDTVVLNCHHSVIRSVAIAAVKQALRQPTVSSSLLEQIRQAFADYRRSEGCSCCRDMDAHEEAEKRLAELLKPEPYEDGSGWGWSKYCTDR